MATGFAPYLLKHIGQIAGGQIAPSSKITPAGLLQYGIENKHRLEVSGLVRNQQGQLREARVWYRKRATSGSSSTNDGCTITAQPARVEQTIPLTLTNGIGIYISDADMARYTDEAVKSVALGLPATQFMQEFLDALISQMNGLVADMNIAILAKQLANFGKNQVTGSTAIKALNFNLDSTINNFGEGMSGLLKDIRKNEMMPNNVAIVGDGIIGAYMEQQAAKSYGLNGVNTALQMMPKFYYDFYASTAWGGVSPTGNEFGVIDMDSAFLIAPDKYVDSFAGVKGASTFGTLSVPMQDSLGGQSLSMMNFDFQLKYNECTSDLDVAGTPTSLGRGWYLIVSKQYDWYNLPSTTYSSGDRLTGNNGTLLYKATNV